MVLHADDPWWRTHYPANGWGCNCYVETLSRRDLNRLGKDGTDEAPPLNWREVTVGAGPGARTVRVPDGIDPGFGHAPGRASQLGAAVRHRIRSAIQLPPGLASRGVAETLALPRPLSALSEEWRRWRRDRDGAPVDMMEVGGLSAEVVDALRARGIELSSAAVTITRQELSHAARSPKAQRGAALDDADWDRIPAILADPEAVLLDTSDSDRPALLAVFTPSGRDKKKGKLAVRINFPEIVKARGRRRLRQSNAIRSAGYVTLSNLKAPNYMKLSGELKK